MPNFNGPKSRLLIQLLTPLVLAIGLSGCSDSSPIEVGFIAGTSGRVADLGVDGRDGTILATEQFNANGGINGRPIRLLFRDDQQNTELARQHTQELIDKKVSAIIGPMTSSIAMAIEPMATESRILMFGGTVTTNQLTRQDDYFFRVLAPTRVHAIRQADSQIDQGFNQFAIAIDTSNHAYTRSWADDFSSEIRKQGGQVVSIIEFESSASAPFPIIAQQLVDSGAKAVALVSNSVDTALLTQQLRKIKPELHIIASAWAGTERLIELGGQAVEGVQVAQYLDRYSDHPDYLRFREQYLQRFGNEPGFAGLVGYNTANCLYQAMQQQQAGEDLKQTMLRVQHFSGIQTDIRFDQYGDNNSQTYMTEIVEGQFRLIER